LLREKVAAAGAHEGFVIHDRSQAEGAAEVGYRGLHRAATRHDLLSQVKGCWQAEIGVRRRNQTI
jgi:hypothetical protein